MEPKNEGFNVLNGLRIIVGCLGSFRRFPWLEGLFLRCFSLPIRIGRGGAVVVASLIGLPLSACSADLGKPLESPSQVVFDYRWEGDILESDFNEPSGLVFDPRRECLFVVGDEGDIAQIELDGSVVREHNFGNLDLEGITIVPDRDRLYIAVEGEEAILEVHPESFETLRRFELERQLNEQVLFPSGGDGVEGITFVPKAAHPEGGVFLVTNQSFSLEPDAEPSLIVEVSLPLTDEQNDSITVRPLGKAAPGVIDLSALNYHSDFGSLFVVSDATNTLIQMDRQWKPRKIWAFTGNDQEGLAFDSDGYLYIAQDSGGIIKIWPRSLQGR